MEIDIPDLKTLQRFAKNFVKTIEGGEVIALQGDLGAGKTALTKALLKEAGVKKTVSSPTFVLMIPYRTRLLTFYHMDLYRISGYKDIQALGVEELWQKDENVFLIEWAEKIKNKLPRESILIKIEAPKTKKPSNTTRRITIKNVPKNLKI